MATRVPRKLKYRFPMPSFPTTGRARPNLHYLLFHGPVETRCNGLPDGVDDLLSVLWTQLFKLSNAMIKDSCVLRTGVMAAEGLPITTNTLRVYGTPNPGIHLDPGDHHACQFLYTYRGSDPLDYLPAIGSAQTIHKGVVQIVNEAGQLCNDWINLFVILLLAVVCPSRGCKHV